MIRYVFKKVSITETSWTILSDIELLCFSSTVRFLELQSALECEVSLNHLYALFFL